jgi:hypothetical protein
MLYAAHYGVGTAHLASTENATLEQYMIAIVFTRGSSDFVNNAR